MYSGKCKKGRVQMIIVCGSETWPMGSENMQRLGRADRLMVRLM